MNIKKQHEFATYAVNTYQAQLNLINAAQTIIADFDYVIQGNMPVTKDDILIWKKMLEVTLDD